LTNVLAIGQSNLASVVRAADQMKQSGRFPSGLSIEFIQLRQSKYVPNLNGPDEALNRSIVTDVEALAGGVDLVVSCLGGNAHSVLGLLNHPTRPWDFVLDLEPNIPLDPGREVVACELVRAALKARMTAGLRLFSALRALIQAPFAHCESPPPVPSESHIKAHPGLFRDKIEKRGVAPASFRLKLWKLQSDVYREFCRSHDIAFLPVPPEVIDAAGLMTKNAWAADPTHGNPWYGERVILQLESYVHA
jgi:hypothetical protein